jgi:hypothetical protein
MGVWMQGGCVDEMGDMRVYVWIGGCMDGRVNVWCMDGNLSSLNHLELYFLN